MAQAKECLLCKCKALSSNPSPTKNKQTKTKKEKKRKKNQLARREEKKHQDIDTENQPHRYLIIKPFLQLHILHHGMNYIL
jgi:hypothetical protein